MGLNFVIRYEELLRLNPVDFLSEGGALFIKTFDELGLFFDNLVVMDKNRRGGFTRRSCFCFFEAHELIGEVGPFYLHGMTVYKIVK